MYGWIFSANQYSSVLKSNAVDYRDNGPGDEAFPKLLAAIEKNDSVDAIFQFIYKEMAWFQHPRCLIPPFLL